jgi:hypothetical protein
MTESVAEKLLAEIERVSAKRERWRGYRRDMGAAGFGMELSIAVMSAGIDLAKAALLDNDAIACVVALRELQDYDDND